MEAPPKIKQPGKLARGLIPCLAIIIAVLAWNVWSRIPPKEAKVIERFQQRRGTYERLKEMLDSDVQVKEIRSYGASMEDPAQLAPERVQAYMALLRDMGGELVLQAGERSNRVVKIYTWIWGWAGLSRDVGISWNERLPTNQVQALFGRRPPGSVPGRDVFYKHIDKNWYVWANF